MRVAYTAIRHEHAESQASNEFVARWPRHPRCRPCYHWPTRPYVEWASGSWVYRVDGAVNVPQAWLSACSCHIDW